MLQSKKNDIDLLKESLNELNIPWEKTVNNQTQINDIPLEEYLANERYIDKSLYEVTIISNSNNLSEKIDVLPNPKIKDKALESSEYINTDDLPFVA